MIDLVIQKIMYVYGKKLTLIFPTKSIFTGAKTVEPSLSEKKESNIISLLLLKLSFSFICYLFVLLLKLILDHVILSLQSSLLNSWQTKDIVSPAGDPESQQKWKDHMPNNFWYTCSLKVLLLNILISEVKDISFCTLNILCTPCLCLWVFKIYNSVTIWLLHIDFDHLKKLQEKGNIVNVYTWLNHLHSTVFEVSIGTNLKSSTPAVSHV